MRGPLIKHLPDLLARLNTACIALDGEDRLTAYALAADAKHVAAGLLLKLDGRGLAYLAADLGMRTTGQQRPGHIGASARIVTRTLMRGKHPASAVTTAQHARRATRPEHRHPYTGVAVGLRSPAAARRGRRAQDDQRATAHELPGEADDATRRLGRDANLRWTAFGPVNTKIRRVNIAVTLGDAGTAVDVARGIDLDTIAVTERRATIFIDTTRAFLQWGRLPQVDVRAVKLNW